MRIQIKTDEKNLNIVLPTKLLFGRGTVFLANTIGRKYAGKSLDAVPPQALKAICAELCHIKDTYGKWDLVDIESATGEIIKVIL